MNVAVLRFPCTVCCLVFPTIVMTDRWAIIHKAEFPICQPLRCFALQMSQKFYIKLPVITALHRILNERMSSLSWIALAIFSRKLNWNFDWNHRIRNFMNSATEKIQHGWSTLIHVSYFIKYDGMHKLHTNFYRCHLSIHKPSHF